MKHVQTIRAFIKTLMNSENFHALVVQSPPGWGKSTTIDAALGELEVNAVVAGAYATPLHIYNTLCNHPDALIVFDDCAGLFSDPKSMAVLKAATWPSSGPSSSAPARRRVAWGSASQKVEQEFVDFAGKIILLTNVVPAGKETEAFLSRCLSYRISIGPGELKEMLMVAAASLAHFAKPEMAHEVASFLCDDSIGIELAKVNLRTLKMGYELAMTHPEDWRELFVHLLPRDDAKAAAPVARILQSGLSAKEQEAQFTATTGKSRRTFYNLKKELGLTRPYRAKSPD